MVSLTPAFQGAPLGSVYAEGAFLGQARVVLVAVLGHLRAQLGVAPLGHCLVQRVGRHLAVRQVVGAQRAAVLVLQRERQLALGRHASAVDRGLVQPSVELVRLVNLRLGRLGAVVPRAQALGVGVRQGIDAAIELLVQALAHRAQLRPGEHRSRRADVAALGCGLEVLAALGRLEHRVAALGLVHPAVDVGLLLHALAAPALALDHHIGLLLHALGGGLLALRLGLAEPLERIPAARLHRRLDVGAWAQVDTTAHGLHAWHRRAQLIDRTGGRACHLGRRLAGAAGDATGQHAQVECLVAQLARLAAALGQPLAIADALGALRALADDELA
jgi:hypothetical protein